MGKILIVEDHGVVRAGICHILEKENGLEVVGVAVDGAQALEFVRNGLAPDVVLCDLNLGDMSGITLIRELQRLIPTAGVIVLTVESSDQYLSEAFQAGAKGYLLKGADSDELVYSVRKVLQGNYYICTGLAGRLKDRLVRDKAVAGMQPAPELSERESEILHLLADGFTNIEVADRLFTSKRTVEGHRLSLLHKVGAKNGLELVKLAMLQGLLKIPESTLS